MDDMIKVNFQTVYQKTMELTAFLDQDVIAENSRGYAQVQSLLDQVDGATNAELIAAMTLNKQKTELVAGTLKRLLSYIENAAREIEKQDKHIAGQVGVE